MPASPLRVLALVFALALPVSLAAQEAPRTATEEGPAGPARNGLPVAKAFDFTAETVKDWRPTDTAAWKLTATEAKTPAGEPVNAYELTVKKSNYEPPVRSPYNRAIAPVETLGDFVIELELKSTSKPYNHRSLCLFFNYEDEANFYYVHFGQKTDDHANQIFIVDDKPRTKISTKTTDGTKWDDQWHTAKIVRRVEPGTIEIYFDDMKTPVMTATDKTFTKGRFGIGSFDDPGMFRNVRLFAKPETVRPAMDAPAAEGE